MRARMTELCEALAQMELRLKGGESLTSALRKMPPLRASPDVIEAWEQLREPLLRGESSALPSIGHFKDYLRLQGRLRKLIRQKTFRPKAQATLALVLSLLFVVLSWTFLGAGAFANGATLIAAAFMILTSFVWMKAIERKFLATFWFSEWNFWLLKLSLTMSWGRTLAGAIRECPAPIVSSNWPLPLKKSVKEFQQKIAEARIEDWNKASPSQGHEESQAHFHLTWLATMAASGHPLAQTLREMAGQSLRSFEEDLNERAQRAELWLLLPLFLLNLPAFLILEFGPIFGLLQRGLAD